MVPVFSIHLPTKARVEQEFMRNGDYPDISNLQPCSFCLPAPLLCTWLLQIFLNWTQDISRLLQQTHCRENGERLQSNTNMTLLTSATWMFSFHICAHGTRVVIKFLHLQFLCTVSLKHWHSDDLIPHHLLVQKFMWRGACVPSISSLPRLLSLPQWAIGAPSEAWL